MNIGGLLCCNGHILPSLLIENIPPEKKTIPIFISHGTADDIIPFSWSVKQYENLKNAGFNIEFQEEEQGHPLTDTQLRKMEVFYFAATSN